MTRRVSALALGILLGVALIPHQGFAHAAYKDSEPKDGETVSSPPSRVTAEFTEQVVQDSYLQVFDACGRQVDNGDSLVVHDRVTVSMSGEARGVYLVRFNVVSAVDGHQTVGSFDFTSSGGAECPAEEPPPQQEGGSSGEGSGSAPESGSSHTETNSASAAQSSELKRDAPRKDAKAEVRGKRTGDGDAPRSRGDEATGDVLAQSPAPEERKASIWSGIPLGWFAVALVIAALVGAAGGFVYAGIVGPRRI